MLVKDGWSSHELGYCVVFEQVPKKLLLPGLMQSTCSLGLNFASKLYRTVDVDLWPIYRIGLLYKAGVLRSTLSPYKHVVSPSCCEEMDLRVGKMTLSL